jgi:LysR family tcuABC transcriptional regulator
MPLLSEKLYLIQSRQRPLHPAGARIRMADLKGAPLILPTGPHGLRSALDAAFARARIAPTVISEIDSLSMLMEAVDLGLGCTLQPGAALGRFSDAKQRFLTSEIAQAQVRRHNSLCSLSDDELSPAALAARVVLADCVRQVVASGRWQGAHLMA